MMRTQTFADAFVRMLEQQKMSRKDFMLRTGFSKGTLSRWINGSRVPDARTIEWFCLKLGIDPSYFLNRAPKTHKPNHSYHKDSRLTTLAASKITSLIAKFAAA